MRKQRKRSLIIELIGPDIVEMDVDEHKVDPALLVEQKANGEILGKTFYFGIYGIGRTNIYYAGFIFTGLWPRDKMVELLDRISESIPDNDNLKYSSRLARLDWNAISFDDYSSTDCEKMWKKVQDKSRCYRLLGEIISEAKNSLTQRSNSFYYALQKVGVNFYASVIENVLENMS